VADFSRLRSHLIFVAWAVLWILAAVWSSRTQSRAGVAEQFALPLITIAGFSSSLESDWRSDGLSGLWTLPDWASWIMTGLNWGSGSHSPGGLGFTLENSGPPLSPAKLSTGLSTPAHMGLCVIHLQRDHPRRGGCRHLEGQSLRDHRRASDHYRFWIKARLEERSSASNSAPKTYAAYRHRVPMLFPKLLR